MNDGESQPEAEGSRESLRTAPAVDAGIPSEAEARPATLFHLQQMHPA